MPQPVSKHSMALAAPPPPPSKGAFASAWLRRAALILAPWLLILLLWYAVRASGLRYSNLPLRGAADLTRENVAAFDALLRDSSRPVLVHCASGNRVGAMAALRAAWVDGKPADEAIAIGRTWGLKGLEGEVRRRLESGPAYGQD